MYWYFVIGDQAWFTPASGQGRAGEGGEVLGRGVGGFEFGVWGLWFRVQSAWFSSDYLESALKPVPQNRITQL